MKSKLNAYMNLLDKYEVLTQIRTADIETGNNLRKEKCLVGVRHRIHLQSESVGAT
jgi:hypothetical protein